MSTRQCKRCDGMGIICARCGQPHTAWNKSFRRCRSRKTIPCPGAPVKPKDGEVVRVGPVEIVPHFETRTECDVCRVQKRGEFHGRTSDGRRSDSDGWDLVTRPGPEGHHLYLCPACTKRHEQIRTMTLEYLMNDRGGLCGGQWVDRNGVLLPDESAGGASTPHPGSET